MRDRIWLHLKEWGQSALARGGDQVQPVLIALFEQRRRHGETTHYSSKRLILLVGEAGLEPAKP
jgi:hypothetical protein